MTYPQHYFIKYRLLYYKIFMYNDINQQWIQITESEMDHSKQLAKLVSFVFSDEYLNVHSELRKKITADRKGYVAVQYIAMIDIIQHFFESLVVDLSLRVQLLVKNISDNCPNLLVHNKKVRRICPFDGQKLKRIKPIYLENIQKGTTISIVRGYLGNSAFSTIKDLVSSDVDYVTIYAPDYRQAIDQFHDSIFPFKIVNYQIFCKEIYYQSIFWEKQERSFYAYLVNQKKKQLVWTTKEENHLQQLDQINNTQMIQQRYDHAEAQFDCFVKIPNPSINYLLQCMVSKTIGMK